MIAIIGPILWLTKGRKYLVKKTKEEKRSIRAGFSFIGHYKELFRKSNNLLGIIGVTAIGLITLGFAVRFFDLNFFWESKYFGYGLLLLAMALFLWLDIKSRKEKGIARVWSIIGFVLICLYLFQETVETALELQSPEYESAKSGLLTYPGLNEKIGSIDGFGLVPGTYHSAPEINGTDEFANMDVIIKGSERYVERTVYLEKDSTANWEVMYILE